MPLSWTKTENPAARIFIIRSKLILYPQVTNSITQLTLIQPLFFEHFLSTFFEKFAELKHEFVTLKINQTYFKYLGTIN